MMRDKNHAGKTLEPLGGGYFAAVAGVHRFGTDAVLLADFAAPKSSKRLCDLCAGCGIVSLLWCASQPDARRWIDAFEIQRDAVDLIEYSAQFNHFDGLHGIEADLRTLGGSFTGAYDLVACNPPYTKAGTGPVSRVDTARTARHELLCTLEEVVVCGARLLRNGGRFCLCHRPERLAELFFLMRQYGVEPKRLRFVQQRTDTRPWLILVEGKKGGRAGLVAEPTLLVEDVDGTYSSEMRKIYQKLE